MAGRSIGLIALACSAAAVTWLAAQTAAPQVFILSGQSNMVGQGRTADLPDALTRLPPNVTYYLNGEPTSFAAQPQFGPEVSFTHELANAWPGEPIIVIKFAVGGTSLLAWAPEWRQALARRTRNENQGPLYQRLMGYIASAEIGPRPRLAAVLWMQGERDARYPLVGWRYRSNLTTLVERLRQDLESPTLPFIYGQVNPPMLRYPGFAIVRKAQAEAERTIPFATMVSTDGVSKHDDDLHYDSEGQLELGRRFARAYLELEGRR